jgi:ribonuclease Z
MELSNFWTAHSKALYSTWLYWRPHRLLFDCGEGCATTLGAKSFGVDRVFLTHGHIDHIAGLQALLFARSAGMGDKTKPLTVYHPVGDPNVEPLKTYLGWALPDLPYPLQWVPLKAGQSVPLSDRVTVVSFPTRHADDRLTLGYRVVSAKTVLKPEYAALPSEQVQALMRENRRNEMLMMADQVHLALSGDTVPLDPDPYRHAEVMAHECTFLDPADAKYPSHSALPDVMALAVRAEPKALLLYHVSTRYSPAQTGRAVAEWCREHKVGFPVWVQYGDGMWDAYRPTDGH